MIFNIMSDINICSIHVAGFTITIDDNMKVISVLKYTRKGGKLQSWPIISAVHKLPQSFSSFTFLLFRVYTFPPAVTHLGNHKNAPMGSPL